MKTVRAEGIELRYTEFGHGPVVVWLHGGGPGASGMSNFGKNLQAFSGYQNIVFDLPGFGASDKPVIRQPLISYGARQIVAALDNLSIDKAHFIGNSMGGAIATKVAIDRPDLVNRLVLMGGAGTIPAGTRRLPEGLQLILRDIIEGSTREQIAEFARTIVFDQQSVTDALVDERYQATLDPQARAAQAAATPAPVKKLLRAGVPIGKLLGAVPMQRLALRVLAARLGDITGELDRVKSPALLTWGSEDRFIPVSWGLELLRGIRDSTMVVVPRCGHWVHYEHATVFEQLVLRFFADGVTPR